MIRNILFKGFFFFGIVLISILFIPSLILPPTSVVDGDIIKVGRNTNDIKIIPKKKKIVNKIFLII